MLRPFCVANRKGVKCILCMCMSYAASWLPQTDVVTRRQPTNYATQQVVPIEINHKQSCARTQPSLYKLASAALLKQMMIPNNRLTHGWACRGSWQVNAGLPYQPDVSGSDPSYMRPTEREKQNAWMAFVAHRVTSCCPSSASPNWCARTSESTEGQ